jgi:hypothetical protein
MTQRTSAAYESKGTQALEVFQKAIVGRWSTLTLAQRRELGTDPENVVEEIRLRAELVAKDELTVPRKSVAERRERRKERALAHGTLPPEALPHLDPDGPAAEREALGSARRAELRIPLRQLDDISVALGSFDVRDLPRLQKRISRLRIDLERLSGTPLGRRVVVSLPNGRQCHSSGLAALRWYETEFVRHLATAAKRTGKRQVPGMRRVVLSLLTFVRKATGRDQFAKTADLLNWLAPLERGEWMSRTLSRWKREYEAGGG